MSSGRPLLRVLENLGRDEEYCLCLEEVWDVTRELLGSSRRVLPAQRESGDPPSYEARPLASAYGVSARPRVQHGVLAYLAPSVPSGAGPTGTGIGTSTVRTNAPDFILSFREDAYPQ